MKKLLVLSENSEKFKEGHREYYFQCKGCNMLHSYVTEWSKKAREERYKRGTTNCPIWNFNGNLEKPTFTPSLLYSWGKPDGVKHVCHLYVTDGQIKYLGDCTHDFRNQTIEMDVIIDNT